MKRANRGRLKYPWRTTPPGGWFHIKGKTRNCVQALCRYWSERRGRWACKAIGPGLFRVERIDDGSKTQDELEAEETEVNVFTTPLQELVKQLLNDATHRGTLHVVVNDKGDCYAARPDQQIRAEWLAGTCTENTPADMVMGDLVERTRELIAARVRKQDVKDRAERWAK